MRIGIGYDVHRLVYGRKLILGGIEIPFEKGLLGHSDADVLSHAVIDALIGAAGMGDIGLHFPDSDDRYKDISSLELIKMTNEILKKKGYKIVNIDSVVIFQKPRFAPYAESVRKSLADALEIDETQINIKAKTEEGIGFTGRGEGIKAEAVALVEHI